MGYYGLLWVTMGRAVSSIKKNIVTHRNSYELIVTHKILYCGNWVYWGYWGFPQTTQTTQTTHNTHTTHNPQPKATKRHSLLTLLITNYYLLIDNYIPIFASFNFFLHICNVK